MIALPLVLACLLLAPAVQAAPPSPNEERDLILTCMQQELARNQAQLRLPGLMNPYYLAFSLLDSQGVIASAAYGALNATGSNHNRVARVELRVGGYDFDNTRVGAGDTLAEDETTPSTFANAPLDDDMDALRTTFWQLADAKFKHANEDFFRKKAALSSQPDDPERPADFCAARPCVMVQDFKPFDPDISTVEDLVRGASKVFKQYPDLTDSEVDLSATRTRRYLVNSEGSRVAQENVVWNLYYRAESQARDGMPLSDEESVYVRDKAALPDAGALNATLSRFAENFLAKRGAPAQEPYTGPAILEGEAAGVFFHEVVGHRLEGERQKDDREGQTFKDKVGQRIMPAFLSLEDDPTLAAWEGVPLNGTYAVDDQGQPAQRAELVRNGRLVGFLMSRSPIKGFPASNGHGRDNGSNDAVGRMGNLILRSTHAVSDAALKRLLIRECRSQGKPYGLRITRISGGDTTTGRGGYQAFRGTPLDVYRVWAGDGHEERVRGVEIVGTPLSALNKIVATGRKASVFNGVCWAASGWINVSSVAPSILLSELEVQGRDDTKRRLMILKPPFARSAKP